MKLDIWQGEEEDILRPKRMSLGGFDESIGFNFDGRKDYENRELFRIEARATSLIHVRKLCLDERTRFFWSRATP